MIDLDRVTGFDWDRGNARKSTAKHAVAKTEAEEMFFNRPLLLVHDVKHSHTELRFHALGQTNNGRLLHVTFTLRRNGELIRVISARDMHRKERATYGKA